MPIKVLVAGDVGGNIPALFQRVATVNVSAAGPFECLLCVGEVVIQAWFLNGWCGRVSDAWSVFLFQVFRGERANLGRSAARIQKRAKGGSCAHLLRLRKGIRALSRSRERVSRGISQPVQFWFLSHPHDRPPAFRFMSTRR